MRAAVIALSALSALPLLAAWSVPSARAADCVFTRTMDVEALAVGDDTLWVATRGGVEAYALDTLKRRRVYTTADGLAANHVFAVSVDGVAVTALVDGHVCTLAAAEDRFVCADAARAPVAQPAVAESYGGWRVTARANAVTGAAKRRFVATAGDGVWVDGAHARRITPGGRICSNHITTFASWKGATWMGSFDEGLCRWDGKSFVTPSTPFRMVNDLAATPRGLYVAAGEGLFVSKDGKTFARVPHMPDEGFNDLALDGEVLYATNPGGLWRLPLLRGKAARKLPRANTWWRPGGARSLQAVAAAGGQVWLASEDHGGILVDDEHAELHDRAAGLPSSWALDVALADGHVYLATLRHGLVVLAADGAMTRVPGLESAWLLHVSADPDGRTVWIGAQGGAYRLDADGTLTTLADLPHANVHAIWHAGESLWIGTEGGTVLRATS